MLKETPLLLSIYELLYTAHCNYSMHPTMLGIIAELDLPNRLCMLQKKDLHATRVSASYGSTPVHRTTNQSLGDEVSGSKCGRSLKSVVTVHALT